MKHSDSLTKLKHDLRSDIAAILEAAGHLGKIPGTPPTVVKGLELIFERKERVLSNLEKLIKSAEESSQK